LYGVIHTKIYPKADIDKLADISSETGDILKAMQKADARMYAVKEDYYMRHSKCELHS